MSGRVIGVIEGALLIILIATVAWRITADRKAELDDVQTDVAALMRQADTAYESLDLTRASVAYADVLKRDSENLHARIRLANIFHRNNWNDNATQLLSETLERDPQNAAARLLFAKIYRDEGLSADAAREYEAVLATDPHNAEAHYYLGTAYQASEKFADAIRAYTNAAEADGAMADPTFERVPFGIQARIQLGRTYRQLARYQFQNGTYEDGMELLGLALAEMRTAHELVINAKLTGFGDARLEYASTLAQKAQMLRRNRQPESDVLAVYQRITEVDRDDVGAWIEAGQIIYLNARSREDLEEALRHFDTAYDLDPRDIDAHTGRTAVQQDLDRTDAELDEMLADAP